nr:unnamed protein product [Callosobruchus chinensis]
MITVAEFAAFGCGFACSGLQRRTRVCQSGAYGHPYSPLGHTTTSLHWLPWRCSPDRQGPSGVWCGIQSFPSLIFTTITDIQARETLDAGRRDD